ncbi:MAG TPA: LLM class flavin-dependent oxidoreductase [Methylomirabilota bacterium]|nr:LLM class flavin-dependent oxidoreductase [Methylomirabilota bacterium]
MSLPPDLQFYFMHFMPYIHLPEGHKQYESLWVEFPNRFYDPVKGHQLYQRYISEFVLADKLGYDGLVVNEHHSTTYSMMPACGLIAATLIPQTKRAKVCVFGTPVNLEYPNRLAEEYAMLDVLSAGRLEVAFPLGTGMEYWSNPANLNPTTCRDRFREAIDIIIKAWTEDGPSTYDGEFYSYRYLNVWPKPYQKPHPKVYIVGTGSPETLQLTAERGFGYASVFVPTTQQVRSFYELREKAATYGHTIRPDQIIVNAIVYVAESEEQAMREGKEHIAFFFEDALRTTPRFLAPPGYLTTDQLRKRMTATALHGKFDWDMMASQFRVVLGTPERVAEAIAHWVEEANSSRVVLHLHLGNMPHWKAVKNLTLFAEEVMPRLRKLSPAAAPTDGRRAAQPALQEVR